MSKLSTLGSLRKSLNLTQTALAELLKTSRPTYILIENGEKELTLNQAQTLSALYNIPLESLLSGGVHKHQVVHKEVVEASLPTDFGDFVVGVWNQKKGDEVVYMRTKDIGAHKPVLVRVHSECLTGDVFHSNKCDCGEQKDQALKMITDSGNGVLIYLRQEGRGIGLYEKIKAYVLQEEGYDTHEANILLGHKPDQREYSWVRKVLDHLGVSEIKLLTNNPSKVSEISQLGIKVVDRVPLIVGTNQHNRKYFETKKNKFKHYFGSEESNYFYQFSYLENKDQVHEIGEYLRGKQKDPLLKICMGIYMDSHLLEDNQTIKNIEEIFKAAEQYEGFVPIIHFTFKYSSNYKKDIESVRSKMPFVKYIQLNDLDQDHLETLKFANKFFLVDIPLSNKEMYLLDNSEFVLNVKQGKAFILLDNSHGSGQQDSKTNIIKNINLLLEKNINDIAIYGGFGPDTLNIYFELKEHYKINLSIDAETKLKSNGKLDLEKVKSYLDKLISHKKDIQISTNSVEEFKEVFCDENEIIKNILSEHYLSELKGNIVDVGGGQGDILSKVIPNERVLHLDVLDFSDSPLPGNHSRLVGNFLEEETIQELGKPNLLFLCHVLQYLDIDLVKLEKSIRDCAAQKILLVEDLNNDFLGEVLKFSKQTFKETNGEEQIPDFPWNYKLVKSVPFTATLKCRTFEQLAAQCVYIMDLNVNEKNIKTMQKFLEEHLRAPEFKINQEVNLYVKTQ